MKCVIFNLDGALTDSKEPIPLQTASLLNKLMKKCHVAIISGGTLYQLGKQVLDRLSIYSSYNPNQLYLFPTNAASFYKFSSDINDWKMIYSEVLSINERKKIISIIEQMLVDLYIEKPNKIWGSRIEDRETQVTFSAFGQYAPMNVKQNWDPNFVKRLEMIEYLLYKLPGYDIFSGGTTSIDITSKGFDRKLAVEKVIQQLNIELNDVIYVSDLLYEGGADNSIKTLGITTIYVADPYDVQAFIEGCLI